MQYHGIASYTFEYKLSTDTEWTTVPMQNSCEYTSEGLAEGKNYDLRVTVVDRAGNSSTGENSAKTSTHEKNPGGVITDITSSDNILDLSTFRFNYEWRGKELDFTQPVGDVISWDESLARCCGKV